MGILNRQAGFLEITYMRIYVCVRVYTLEAIISAHVNQPVKLAVSLFVLACITCHQSFSRYLSNEVHLESSC